MNLALEQAQQALPLDEVPVGAVLVVNNQLIASANNSPISQQDPTAHAEVLVIRHAARQLGNYRLPGSTLYVTLEPCMMCAGALLHARVERLVFGAYDEKTGAAGSRFDWLQDDRHLHKVKVDGGVLENECAELLQLFFRQKRAARKQGLHDSWKNAGD